MTIKINNNLFYTIAFWWLRKLLYIFGIGISLLVSANTLIWDAAWIFLIITFVLEIGIATFTHKELIGENAIKYRGSKKWDKKISSIITFWGPISIVIFSGLDYRFSSILYYSKPIQNFAFFLLLVNGLLVTWSVSINPFYAKIVRIQYERHHYVVASGPYQLVRHPGYLGSILFAFATPFALESVYALIPAFCLIFFIVLRTYYEDLILNRQFKGYYDYSKQVRYRLIPFIW